jgi:hypothetical protein
VAFEHGFPETGQFAAYYPAHYGETPSETPEGKATNLVVFRSQGYQTGKVPLSWAQVRNVYLIIAPIFAVILYFSWGDLTTWAKTQWVSHQPLHIQAAPPEGALDAANSATACGSVMKLEGDWFPPAIRGNQNGHASRVRAPTRVLV